MKGEINMQDFFVNTEYINKYLIKPGENGVREDTKLAQEYTDEQIAEFVANGYVVVEDDDFQRLIGNYEDQYGINPDGTLFIIPPYVPTVEEQMEAIKQELINAVQSWMDGVAQTRGYDNIHTACSYVNSTDEIFAAEGTACLAWRDTVWRTCYAMLDEVLAGEREIPTKEELLAELPKLTWPDGEVAG